MHLTEITHVTERAEPSSRRNAGFGGNYLVARLQHYHHESVTLVSLDFSKRHDWWQDEMRRIYPVIRLRHLSIYRYRIAVSSTVTHNARAHFAPR